MGAANVRNRENTLNIYTLGLDKRILQSQDIDIDYGPLGVQ